MVRNYQKKTDRQLHIPRKLKKALVLLKEGYSIRTAAVEVKVNRGTLFTLWKEKKMKMSSVASTSVLLMHHSKCLVKLKRRT